MEDKNKKIVYSFFSIGLFIIFLLFLYFEIRNIVLFSKPFISIMVYSSLISFIFVSYYAHYRFFNTKIKRVLKACLILLVGFFSLLLNEKLNGVDEDITLLKYSIVFRKEEGISNGEDFSRFLVNTLKMDNVVVDEQMSINDLISSYNFGDQDVLMSITAENIDKSIRTLEFELLNQENYSVHLIKLRSNLTMIGIVSTFFFTILTIKE